MANTRIKQPGSVPLECECCTRPFARIVGNSLEIESRHGSDTHRNSITLSDLLQLLCEVRPELMATLLVQVLRKMRPGWMAALDKLLGSG